MYMRMLMVVLASVFLSLGCGGGAGNGAIVWMRVHQTLWEALPLLRTVAPSLFHSRLGLNYQITLSLRRAVRGGWRIQIRHQPAG